MDITGAQQGQRGSAPNLPRVSPDLTSPVANTTMGVQVSAQPSRREEEQKPVESSNHRKRQRVAKLPLCQLPSSPLPQTRVRVDIGAEETRRKQHRESEQRHRKVQHLLPLGH